MAPYLERAAFKRERLGREYIFATIKHGPRTVQIRLAVGCRELLKDLAVHGRRHIRGDSDIIVVDHDIGQSLNFKEVGVDVDCLAQLAWSWSTDILRHLNRWSRHHGRGGSSCSFTELLFVGTREEVAGRLSVSCCLCSSGVEWGGVGGETRDMHAFYTPLTFNVPDCAFQ